MKQRYVVPMVESDIQRGRQIDGYAGPFPARSSAEVFARAYNARHNRTPSTPEWCILASEPVPYTDQRCEYRSRV